MEKSFLEQDFFLSEEDLALRELSFAELIKYWDYWLRQAQVTNSADEYLYSHGVFEEVPLAAREKVK